MFGSAGITAIVKHPAWFQKHYGKKVDAITSYTSGRLQEATVEFIAATREEHHPRPTSVDPEIADEGRADVAFVRTLEFAQLTARVADCRSRVARACHSIRSIGWALVLLAALIVVNGALGMVVPSNYAGWLYVSWFAAAMVAFYILLELRTYSGIAERTETEFGEIPPEKRPEW